MLETAVASVPLLTLKRSGAHGGAHGIPAIRHHLKTVDDVPLLVSIFTDSTPSNVSDMIRNGDVRILECLLPQRGVGTTMVVPRCALLTSALLLVAEGHRLCECS